MEITLKLILTCLMICGAKIVEISIQSIKTVCMVKGERKLAAALAFVECLLWGFVISSVITSLSSNVLLLLSYCIGYASGLFLGSIIESKIALGTSNVQIMVDNDHVALVEKYLKERGHGFTVLDGRGSKETMHVVIIVLARKEVKKTMKAIRQICDNDVFIVSSEISNFTGGYGIRK
jgi:uncharacterized protein YebE (UPF0316 family)